MKERIEQAVMFKNGLNKGATPPCPLRGLSPQGGSRPSGRISPNSEEALIASLT